MAELAGDDAILAQLGLLDPSTGEAFTSGTSGSAPGGEVFQGPARSQWDTDANPYFKRVQEIEKNQPTIGQSLESYQATLRAQAQEAISVAVQNNIPLAMAQAVIAPQLEAELAKSELVANRQATLPMARRQAAEGIAKELSTREVVINPDELLSEQSLEGMRARGATLRDERRKFRYDSRRITSADRAEGAPNASTQHAAGLDDLSSFGKIKAGLLRGDVKQA